MYEHPPQISGGYRRRLKKKESSKGFTLVELIVVIVILAILAAILIPGLLKWIDQAKDKKYELEAREIALAAEAALAKVYADGAEVVEKGDSNKYIQVNGRTDLMEVEGFLAEIKNLSAAELIGDISMVYGAEWNEPAGTSERPWGGSVSGYWIMFKASDGTRINASYSSADGWIIKNDSTTEAAWVYFEQRWNK